MQETVPDVVGDKKEYFKTVPDLNKAELSRVRHVDT